MIGDLSQLSDIVSRKKISDRRLRNEQIRRGFQDSGQFSLDNQQQIQQAQQPSEFWGAGRKEAKIQAADVEAANLVGGLHNLGGKHYYYGDRDTSTAQFGTKGYTLKDIGSGKYDILGADNKSIGTSYDDPYSAAKKILNQNLVSSITPETRTISSPESPDSPLSGYTSKYFYGNDYDFSPISRMNAGNAFWTPPSTNAEITTTGLPALTGETKTPSAQEQFLELIKNQNPLPGQGDSGLMGDWEILGQVLRGTPLHRGRVSGRYLPSNMNPEEISGLETLYGSTPLIWDNKLEGYKMDLGVADPSMPGYQNPFHIAKMDDSGTTVSNYQLARDIKSPEEWQKIGKTLGDNKFFVPTENADKIPGWTNRDEKMYAHSNNSPLVGAVGTLLSIFGGPYAPIGYAINAGSAMDQGNYVGALGSFAGATGAFDSLSSGLSNMSGMSVPVSRAFISGGMGGLGALQQGKDFLPAALGAGLGSYFGGELAGLTKDALGEIGSKALGGAASGGLNSLFTKGDAVKGSLFGGMSGGLHGYLNSVSRDNNTFNSEQDKINRQQAQQAAKLAKLFINRK